MRVEHEGAASVAAAGDADHAGARAILAAAGVETVVFGPGGSGAHAVEEWVDLAEVGLCARTLVGVAAKVCG